MKERKHNRFFDTFELCPWSTYPQRGFIYIYNISVALITRNQIGDVMSYSPPDPIITSLGYTSTLANPELCRHH